MSRQVWKGSTLLNPEPPVLVSCGPAGAPNLITVGWCGTICTQPSMVSISVRPERYSHHLIKESGEFVINLPTWRQAEAVDTVGVKSGRDGDKFALTGLTPEPCTKVKAPQVAECPVSLECKVLEIRPFGTHDMFLAEVVAVRVDDDYMDEKGRFDLNAADLVTYSHGEYFTLGKKLGTFGYSVAKNKPQSIAGNNPKHKSKSTAKKGVKAKGRSGKHTRKEKGKA